MGRPYDVITFDCYGTLIDWERGIIGAFIEASARVSALARTAGYTSRKATFSVLIAQS